MGGPTSGANVPHSLHIHHYVESYQYPPLSLAATQSCLHSSPTWLPAVGCQADLRVDKVMLLYYVGSFLIT